MGLGMPFDVTLAVQSSVHGGVDVRCSFFCCVSYVPLLQEGGDDGTPAGEKARLLSSLLAHPCLAQLQDVASLINKRHGGWKPRGYHRYTEV